MFSWSFFANLLPCVSERIRIWCSYDDKNDCLSCLNISVDSVLGTLWDTCIHNGLFYGMWTEDTQPLIAAAETDHYSWMPYQIAKAEYIPFEQKLADEDEIYFFPSVVESEKCSSLFGSELVRCTCHWLMITDLIKFSKVYGTVFHMYAFDNTWIITLPLLTIIDVQKLYELVKYLISLFLCIICVCDVYCLPSCYC